MRSGEGSNAGGYAFYQYPIAVTGTYSTGACPSLGNETAARVVEAQALVRPGALGESKMIIKKAIAISQIVLMVFFNVGNLSLALADDSDIFGTNIEPNVMIALDSSGSMDE